MQQTPTQLEYWNAPSACEVGSDHIEFLHRLQAPTWITVKGRDSSKSRAIVTLLHGNEPSGLKAVHKLLRDSVTPATDLVIIVASVNAALYPPILSHRYLPWEEDFNRCFTGTSETNQTRLAAEIAQKLLALNPEAVIDTHNTSAHSEPFAVAINDHQPTIQLTRGFTDRLVVIDQKMGTLIEQTSSQTPIVTVEFGGFMDPRADQLAYDSLHAFVTTDALFEPSEFAAQDTQLQVLHHPLRLEIDESQNLHYASSVQDDADLTMINTIDQLNFRKVDAGTNFGWLGRTGLGGLSAVNAGGQNLVDEFFHAANGFLTTRQDITVFMATTDPYIARKDCLLYFTPTK